MLRPGLADSLAGLDVPAPAAVLDLTALRDNAAALEARAGGLPVRVATKSVRCRWVLAELGAGRLMTYSAAESVWLARRGWEDVLLAYPTADTATLAEIAADPVLRERVTVMVDHPDHLALLRAAGAGPDRPVKVCLDLDASLRLGPAHLGVRRSPVRTPAQAAAAARRVVATPGVELAGVMCYDAQVAGVPDASLPERVVKAVSTAELRRRRPALVAAVREVADVPLVNVGGTGSLHLYGRSAEVTEVTAGSGLFGPTLFDGYRAFRPSPALFLVSPVVRRPAPRVATVFSTGFVASGPASATRLPRPVHPPGLRLTGTEGAGEVQTPVVGDAAGGLRVGDLVWFRPAKSGEQLERVTTVHVVDDGGLVASVPTYRGEGMSFG